MAISKKKKAAKRRPVTPKKVAKKRVIFPTVLFFK